MPVKIGSGLVPFSCVVDRFLPGGYRDGLPGDWLTDKTRRGVSFFQ